HADRSQWLSAIADTFEHVLHRAFITADSGYLLLTESLTDTSADLASLLALIDNDFYTNTHQINNPEHLFDDQIVVGVKLMVRSSTNQY
ncbi:hypothetical protein WP50_09135, partial [Lactiplantibacillus plantarum]